MPRRWCWRWRCHWRRSASLPGPEPRLGILELPLRLDAVRPFRVEVSPRLFEFLGSNLLSAPSVPYRPLFHGYFCTQPIQLVGVCSSTPALTPRRWRPHAAGVAAPAAPLAMRVAMRHGRALLKMMQLLPAGRRNAMRSMQRALSAASRTPVSHCCVALVARKRLIDDLRWHDYHD